MQEKRASQWLSSRKSKSWRQSASEDFNTKDCCWYRLLASDIGKVSVPETGILAWCAAKSRRWAGWTWFWKLRGSRFNNRGLMQDTLAPVSQTAVNGDPSPEQVKVIARENTFIPAGQEAVILGELLTQSFPEKSESIFD